jgi:phosphoheptose isomerase
MRLAEQVKTIFDESIKLKKTSGESLAPLIVSAGEKMAECIKRGNKILSCGNGGSACDAMHFNAELVNRFIIERRPLPGITLNTDMAVLTAISNDYSYSDIFSKQIKALGNKGDVFFCISTSGNSENVLKGIVQAHECGLEIIALTGRDGGDVTHALEKGDIELRVPGMMTARIQEVHIVIIHCLCELIDKILFTKDTR